MDVSSVRKVPNNFRLDTEKIKEYCGVKTCLVNIDCRKIISAFGYKPNNINNLLSSAGIPQVAPPPAVSASALQEVPAGLREASQAAGGGVRLRAGRRGAGAGGLHAPARRAPPLRAARPRRAVLAAALLQRAADEKVTVLFYCLSTDFAPATSQLRPHRLPSSNQSVQ